MTHGMCHLQNLHLTLGENAFGPFSFQIDPGERIAILGPSGAGKTTLLKLIAGDMRFHLGVYLFNGIAINAWSLYALSRVRAVLPQSSELAFGLPVKLIIGLGRISIADDTQLADIIVHAAGMARCEHLLDRSFNTLSGGEKARVHLARVFAQLWDAQNGLILVDEPLASLDPGLQIELLEGMRLYASKRNHAIVAVLHDINQAMQHFERLILVKKGNMVGDLAADMNAIPDLARLYNMRLEAVHVEGMPPLIYSRTCSLLAFSSVGLCQQC